MGRRRAEPVVKRRGAAQSEPVDLLAALHESIRVRTAEPERLERRKGQAEIDEQLED